jgi:peptidoglycan hydrolase-like protein with peptidoglycan-binding domain
VGERRDRRRLGRRLAAAAILMAGVAVAAVLLLGSGSRPLKGADAGPRPGVTTSVVTRRTLSESATVEGGLGYGAELDLYNRLAGTFTWLPTVGEVIGRGETLWRIDNRPVVLMYGPVPAYRTLKEGAGDGPDVAELNRNLIDLGFDPYGEIDELAHFGVATAAAVRRWQEAEHLPRSGEVELGRIVFAPGARRVTGLEVVVGQDPLAIGQAEEAPAKESVLEGPAGHEPPAEEPEAGEPTGEKPEGSKPGQGTEAGGPSEEKDPEAEKPTRKPKADRQKNGPEGHHRPSAAPVAAETPGDEGEDPGLAQEPAAAEAALTTTSTRQLVQLELGAAEQGLAKVGRSAPVTLPDGSVVRGHIIEVGKVAEAAETGGPEGGGEPTISVTVVLDRPVAHLDEAPVSVALVRQVRRHVLAVPATALFATAGGGYAVQAVKGSRRVELAVTPGMFADGFVQIEGRGVHRGLRVTEPSE